jgi:hypothetical protein
MYLTEKLNALSGARKKSTNDRSDNSPCRYSGGGETYQEGIADS